MNIPIGRSGFKLTAIASLWDSAKETYDGHEIRAELEMNDDNSKVYFEQLQAQKSEIEQEISEPLTWYNPKDRKLCRIYLRKSTDLQKKETWSEQHEWLLKKLEILHKTFSHRVKEL